MPDLHVPASAGDHQQAYLAVPAVGAGPWPGVVVLQDAFGMTDNLRAHADRLAAAGYVAVAPALYTPRGGGPRCVAAVMRSMVSGDGPVFSDIEAARAWLGGREDCTGRIGVIGFCQGGGFALLSAARHDFAAAAPNYGHVPSDAERALEGACPMVASFGGRDPALRGAGEQLERALDALGVDHDIKTYPEAGHSFMDRIPARAVFRLAGMGHHQPSAEDAWGRILRFFDTHLEERHVTEDAGISGAEIEHYLIDMDGVLVHEENALPGADDFIRRLDEAGKRFLVLTNNSVYTPRDLQARLRASGIDIAASALWTSALATAQFLDSQRPGGSAFVVGEAGLTTALHDIGYILTDRDPDYVVIGETRTYSFEAITRAIRLIQGGARYIVTNPDATGPSSEGTLPAAGAVAALITHATRKSPYFVGKPNPLMIRVGLNTIGAHSETTAMIGDRMDTDMVAGMEAGLHTILVLSGVTDPSELERYPYRPNQVVASVADLEVGVRG